MSTRRPKQKQRMQKSTTPTMMPASTPPKDVSSSSAPKKENVLELSSSDSESARLRSVTDAATSAIGAVGFKCQSRLTW